MSLALLPSLRFARRWVSPGGNYQETVHRIPLASGGDFAATLVERVGSPSPRPGWVVLHGMTRRGRDHGELIRFRRALAATGGRVLIPEIEEWMALRFAPDRAQEIMRASVSWLHADPGTARGGVMLAGLSFGAPQAILAASVPAVAAKLRGVLAWGGYSDLGRSFHFSLTGEHEWRGERYCQDPEPYVRWVIGSNCLGHAFGEEGARVGDALRTLAAAAGDTQSSGNDPRHDALKETLRAGLPAGDRELYDLFVPAPGVPGTARLDAAEAKALVETVLPAIRRASPLLDPLSRIERVGVPVRILHGRSDRLVPFTEALHMENALAPISTDTTMRVTGLFSHSGDDTTGSALARGRESLRLLDALREVFELEGRR